MIEGVMCEGRRTTTTWPVGSSLGNDRPISAVAETWTSPELHLIILSKRTDPRTGERTQRLINLSRVEPSPDLFQPTPDYTVVNGPAHMPIPLGIKIFSPSATTSAAPCLSQGQSGQPIAEGAYRRTGHAILRTFLTYDRTGHRVFDLPGLAGMYCGSMLMMYWYPRGYGPLTTGVQVGNFTVAVQSVVIIVKEFSPDIKRVFHHRS